MSITDGVDFFSSDLIICFLPKILCFAPRRSSYLIQSIFLVNESPADSKAAGLARLLISELLDFSLMTGTQSKSHASDTNLSRKQMSWFWCSKEKYNSTSWGWLSGVVSVFHLQGCLIFVAMTFHTTPSSTPTLCSQWIKYGESIFTWITCFIVHSSSHALSFVPFIAAANTNT